MLPSQLTARRRFERKDTEQFHVCLGGLGLSRHDDRRFALRVLDTIFGGTSSSRLFQEVRERRGLAYSVYSFTSAYQDTGQIGLYVGTRADNIDEAMAVVGSELGRLRKSPATSEELLRAKENLKGRVVLALESTGARMNRLGSEVLAGAPLLSLDDVVAQIDAVSLADISALVRGAVGPRAPIGGRDRTRPGPLRAGPGPAGARAEHMIRVAVAGAHGRMGQAVCRAVQGADDMELSGRADPALGTSVADVLGDADVLVDFTVPGTALENARARRGGGRARGHRDDRL